jgi:3-isopropylmalate dehydrogenase
VSRTVRIVSIPGDGVGPEVTAEATRVLSVLAAAADVALELQVLPFGGASIDAHGVPLTQEVESACRAADAVLLGAVGGPRWDAVDKARRPEAGLLALRKALGVYANLRPARFFAALESASPLRPERTRGVDVMIVRELIGGIYFGTPREDLGHEAYDTMRYSVPEVERVTRVAVELARARSGRVTSVDKANVLDSMRLWRRTVDAIAADTPNVTFDHMYVDAAAMKLVTRPGDFDVIVTGNLFGDILSDAAAALTGSLGMLPSASVGDGPALYEPIHGSAPDIAGKGIANPLGAILSVGMLATTTLGRPDLDAALSAAVEDTLAAGIFTCDIAPDGAPRVGTRAMGDAVLERLRSRLENSGAGAASNATTNPEVHR